MEIVEYLSFFTAVVGSYIMIDGLFGFAITAYVIEKIWEIKQKQSRSKGKGLMNKKTKKFNFGVVYQCYGSVSVEVPADFTQEQAEKYVRDNWADMPFPRHGEYIHDSDEPDFECSDFEDI